MHNIMTLPKALTITVATILTAILTVAAGERIVENPTIRAINTSTLTVTGATSGEDATILDIDATYYPGYWMSVASSSRLKADGKEYKLTKAEGITPDERFLMPESGEKSFRLYFEPVPETATSVDYAESDDSEDFMIWGIDLSGKADPLAVAPGIPEELKELKGSYADMNPATNSASTTIRIHVAGYREGMPRSLKATVGDLSGQRDAGSVELDESGVGTLVTTLRGTSLLTLGTDLFDTNFNATLMPGEDIELWLDANSIGRLAMARRSNEKKERDALMKVPSAYHKGRYAPFDKAVIESGVGEFYDIHNDPAWSYAMTTDRFVGHLLDVHKKSVSEIRKMDVSAETKRYLRLQLDNEMLAAAQIAKTILTLDYWRKMKLELGSPVPEGAITVELTPGDWQRLMDVVENFDDPRRLIILRGLGSAANLPRK